MDYIGVFSGFMKYLMNNDKDKLSLLLNDKSKKQLVFSKLYLQYFLFTLVIVVYMMLVIRRRWEYKLDIIPEFTMEIIRELITLILPLMLSVSFAYKIAISRYLDWRYKRFEKENLYQEGKQYPFLYGAYLHQVKKLRQSLYSGYLIFIFLILLIGIHMYFAQITSLHDFLLNSINWLIYMLIIAYILTTKKYQEFIGSVSFVEYVKDEKDIKGLEFKIWQGRMVYIDDPIYIIFDDNSKKYAKYEILTNSIIDKIENVYQLYARDKIKILIKFLEDKKSKLSEEKKNNPKEIKTINNKILDIDKRIHDLNDFLMSNFNKL